ncbi:MAG TPA: HDOD domain-containing protein [Gammaproteobacteria bacterium]|nr:HDOD domain-containing protein [Gammaproteobacteria bacterium]
MSTNATISIEKLTAQPLPIFEHSARAFRKVGSEGGNTFENYGDIILKDPGLALHTLNQLRSGANKSLHAEISSMAQATMLLGVNRSKRLTVGHPQLERTLSGFAKTGYIRTACRAFHAAFQAWDWAHIKNDHAPDEILLATLLHDVAEMALWVAAPEQMHQFRKLMLKDGLPTDEAQYIAFGASLEHFSREIAARWHLPGLVNDALRPENAHQPRVRGVMLAVQLARSTERGWYWEKTERVLPQIADYLCAPLEEVISHVHQNAVRAAREAPFYSARHAAALLPMLPGGEALIIEDEFPEAEAEIEAAKKPTVDEIVAPSGPATEKQPPPSDIRQNSGPTASEPMAQVCLLPQAGIFTQTLHDLHKGMGKMTLNELMRKTVHGMHDGIGLNRVVFCVLSQKREKLVSRYMLGSDNDPAFSRFEILLDKPHLFTRLMEKQVSLWINDDNRKKFWPLMPDDVKTLIKTNSFFAMSIHVREKPVGLFYADRRSLNCKLDEQAYKQFRKLCQFAAKGLANLAK